MGQSITTARKLEPKELRTQSLYKIPNFRFQRSINNHQPPRIIGSQVSSKLTNPLH
jgi:hypothetical protein